MSTLQQTSLQFNTKCQLSSTGGQLSSESGLVLVKEFMEKIQFDRLVRETVPFNDPRKYCTHEQAQLFQQLLFQLIAGYANDSAADSLKQDPLFSQVFELTASQPTLSRFINQKEEQDNRCVHQLMTRLSELLLTETNQRQVIVDIDSTHSDTFGKQEDSDYNGHYKTNGYHPLLAFEQQTGALLGAQLRPGNHYTSRDSEMFLAPILYSFATQEMECLVRGDSGFAKPEIYELCEQTNTKFIIRLKASQKLKKIAEHLVLYSDETDFTSEEVQWFSIHYQANSWKQPYRVVIKSTRNAGEFLFRHEFLITNLTELFPKQIFPMYQNRGAMENLIKEIKSGFFFDKTDSTRFQANTFRMLLSSVAYNLIQLMKQLVFPENEKEMTIATIRFRFVRVAARFVHHARNIQIKLATSHVFQNSFWKIMRNIQQMRLYSY